MSHLGEDLFEAWRSGELSEAEELAFEIAVQSSEEEAAAFTAWLAANPVEGAPDQAQCEQLVADATRSALAIIAGQDRMAIAGRARRWRLWPVAVAACIGALVAAGVAWLIPEPAGVDPLADRLCESYRQSAPGPLLPALGCEGELNPLLGDGAVGLSDVYCELMLRPRPDDPRWLAARSLVALLERSPDEVVLLLEGREDILAASPRLRSDLAAALLMKGDEEGARAQLRLAVEAAPDDPVLRANLQEVNPRGDTIHVRRGDD